MLPNYVNLVLADCCESGYRFTLPFRHFSLFGDFLLNRFLVPINLVSQFALHYVNLATEFFIEALQCKFHSIIHVVNVRFKLCLRNSFLLLILHHLE